MSFEPFAIERLFARWEFTARHLLSSSDCETVTIGELLRLAGFAPERLLDLRLSYTDSQGEPALRERVAAALGGGVGPEHVVVCAPSEGIRLICEAVLAPGDRVVVQTPCYQALGEIPRQIGCAVTGWPLVETDAGWRCDLDALSELLVPGTKLLIVNAPQSPTGFLPSADEMDRILTLARERGVRVFCDEMYRGLELDPTLRLPPACVADSTAISLGGLSKAYGLPGLRIGWLVARAPALVQAIIERKDYTTICGSGPDQLLACAGLDAAETLAARSRALIAANLERALAFVDRHGGRFAWRAPVAGSVAFPRLLGGGAAAFCERAVVESGVMMVPSTVFDFGDAHIRFGLGRAGFADALAALEPWLATSAAQP